MTKITHFDATTGLILGFYIEGFHDPIPEPNLPIEDADWQRHIDGDVIWRANDARDGWVEHTPDPVPAYPTLEAARGAMIAWIDAFLMKIAGQVPAFERASWPTKAEAARAFVAGTARPDQIALLDAEAGASTRTRAELAAVIIARADAYETIIGQTAGLRVTLDDALEAETDPFKYETILESGMTQAMAMAAALGINTTTA